MFESALRSRSPGRSWLFVTAFVGVATVAMSANAGTFVGNRSVRVTLDLPSNAWTASVQAASPPTLSTVLCAGGGGNGTPVYSNGMFIGWNVVAGSTCLWTFNMGGPVTWTLSDGQGHTVIATVTPASVTDAPSPSLDFQNQVGTPASRLTVGDAALFEVLFDGLPTGTYTVDSSSALGQAVEDVLSIASMGPN